MIRIMIVAIVASGAVSAAFAQTPGIQGSLSAVSARMEAPGARSTPESGLGELFDNYNAPKKEAAEPVNTAAGAVRGHPAESSCPGCGGLPQQAPAFTRGRSAWENIRTARPGAVPAMPASERKGAAAGALKNSVLGNSGEEISGLTKEQTSVIGAAISGAVTGAMVGAVGGEGVGALPGAVAGAIIGGAGAAVSNVVDAISDALDD